MLRLDLCIIQFVHFHCLKLERNESLIGVTLQNQNAAIHFFSLNTHPHDLVKTLRPGHVAVLFFAPTLPRTFQQIIRCFIPGLWPEGEAAPKDIPLICTYHRIQHIRIPFQIPCPCPHSIPAVPVCQFCRLVYCAPVCASIPISGSIITSQVLRIFSPGFPSGSPFRRYI